MMLVLLTFYTSRISQILHFMWTLSSYLERLTSFPMHVSRMFERTLAPSYGLLPKTQILVANVGPKVLVNGPT